MTFKQVYRSVSARPLCEWRQYDVRCHVYVGLSKWSARKRVQRIDTIVWWISSRLVKLRLLWIIVCMLSYDVWSRSSRWCLVTSAWGTIFEDWSTAIKRIGSIFVISRWLTSPDLQQGYKTFYHYVGVNDDQFILIAGFYCCETSLFTSLQWSFALIVLQPLENFLCLNMISLN